MWIKNINANKFQLKFTSFNNIILNKFHKIYIEKDSFLYPSLSDEAYVNSFHHQAIKDLAPHFKVVAKAPDGIIEAIEHESLPIYAVQFHPEALSHKYGEMQDIFNVFIKKCEVK